MNWYCLLKTSMPLPDAEGYPKSGPFGLRGSLSDINHRLTDEHAKDISKSFPGLSYLGDGVDGVAYSHNDPNTIVKITTSSDEAYFAEQVMSQPSPCCAKVFSVQHNENGSKDTWTIVTERVHLLTDDQRKLVHLCLTMNRKPQVLDAESKRFISQFFTMQKCLKALGLPANDSHSSNIGFNSAGRLVLFDFGPNEPIM